MIRLAPSPNRDELLAAVRLVFGADADAAIPVIDDERRTALERRLAAAGQSPWTRS